MDNNLRWRSQGRDNLSEDPIQDKAAWGAISNGWIVTVLREHLEELPLKSRLDVGDIN